MTTTIPDLPPCANLDDSTSEASAVELLRAGDDAQWRTTVEQYGPRMLAVARRMLRCEQEAEDAVQEAFISAMRAIESFRGDSKLSTWLHRVVVNTSLMRLRSRSRGAQSLTTEMMPLFDESGHHARPVSAWTNAPVDQMLNAETRELVRRCIDRLPEAYRTVLILRDIEELDTHDTAVALGVSEGNVKTRLHRARQALRELLDPSFR